MKIDSHLKVFLFKNEIFKREGEGLLKRIYEISTIFTSFGHHFLGTKSVFEYDGVFIDYDHCFNNAEKLIS